MSPLGPGPVSRRTARRGALLLGLCAALALPGCRAYDEKFISFPLNSAVYEYLYWDHALGRDPETLQLREHEVRASQAAAIELVAVYHLLLPVGWLWTALDVAMLPFTLAHDDDYLGAPSAELLPRTVDGTLAVGTVVDPAGYVAGYWVAPGPAAVAADFAEWHAVHAHQMAEPALRVARIDRLPWVPGVREGFRFTAPPGLSGETRLAGAERRQDGAYWRGLRAPLR